MRELSLNVLDIAQNSIAAGASVITMTVEEDAGADRLTLSVEDNGCGMTSEQLERVRDPFYTTRTTRPVGMGIPLFRIRDWIFVIFTGWTDGSSCSTPGKSAISWGTCPWTIRTWPCG